MQRYVLLQYEASFWDNLHIFVMNSLVKPFFLYFCSMKRINWLLITLLLAACSKTDQQLISEAETLVGEHADSALCILNKVEDASHLKGEWKARYWMAMAQAHIGAYQSLSEDSLVLYAAEYYQDKDSAMLCKAHALASSYYWWRDSFAKAKDMMRLSVEESKRANDREGTISKLRSLARMESLEGNLEGLKRYTEEVVKLDGGDKNQAKLLNSLAIEYFYHGNHKAAIATMDRIVAYRDIAADSIYIWNDVMRNYADMLVAMGQLDKGIAMHEQILEHYQHSTILEDNKIGALFSLSHAWLLKGDKQKARQYMDMVDEEKATDATRFCMIAHRMVLNYATTGRYDMTEIAEYANNKRDKREKSEAVAEAKEWSIHNLRDHELMLTVSRQRQLIFFLALTLALISVIFGLSLLAGKRKKLLAKQEEELKLLNEQLKSLQNVRKETPVATAEHAAPTHITFTGSTSDTLSLDIANLVYIEAVGNYVKVYQLLDGKIKNDMLRATSKQMEEQLSAYPMMVRCHRAFIVNLEQVEQIISHTGTTQLVMKNCHDTIPVSRSNMAQIKAAIKDLL